ncbi:MAG: chloride channel protein [Candidatus Eiseniibacteriota bacterium]|nr:MAG: chloride channel protein [Candidatus Eisenbacteria bacterium]
MQEQLVPRTESFPRFRAALRSFVSDENNLIIGLSIVIGVSVGLGSLVFRFLLEGAKTLLFDGLAGPEGTPTYLLVILIPAIGGLLVGPIIHFFASEAKGHGVPEVMSAVALRGGIIRRRVAMAKAVASAICIGSGGSAGREGPIVQIGSAIGSGIGQFARMSTQRLRVLVGCGSAAGIAAVFNAPIAGVMFALEVILGDWGIRTLSPVVLSSVLASVTSRLAVGDKVAFRVPEYHLVSAWEMPIYSLLGILAGIVAVLFIRSLYKMEDLFESLKVPGYLKPAIGGLLVGVLGFFFPQIFSDGYPAVNAALTGQLGLLLLVALVFAKIGATSFTLGSGNSGGIFAPSLFIGAMLGAAVGSVAHTFLPELTATSGAYALVGMAAVVGGTTHAPITAMLIIFEMSNDYSIILPLMLCAAISTLVSSQISKESIYTLKLARRGINLKRGVEVNVMGSITVESIMLQRVNTVPASQTLADFLKFLQGTTETSFPVVDDSGRLVGVLSLEHVREVLLNESRAGLEQILIVQDIADTDPPTLHPGHTLNDAMMRFGKRDSDRLPVVDPGTLELKGIVKRSDVINAYNKALLATGR